MMLIFLVFLEFFLIGGLLWYIRKRNEDEANLIAQRIESSLELKRTMAMGLAYRFNYPMEKNDEGEKIFNQATDIFLQQTPHEFEEFAAEVVQKKFGGRYVTTVKTGDFGVDFEHECEDGLYLGQVKVQKNDLDYSPIALVHSNMIKQEAKGGYVITTADFTDAAKKYAEDLDVKLINGVQLVTYWLETMDSKVYEPSGEFA